MDPSSTPGNASRPGVSHATSSRHASRQPALRLDCVVIGPNDVDIASVQSFMATTRGRSAADTDFRANSLMVGGQRITLMDFLNRGRAAIAPASERLHVCDLPHLGSCYLTSFLKARGLEVELINFFNSGRARLEALLDDRPRAVAITTTFYVSPEPIRDVIEFVRSRCPETTIVVGGPYVNNVCSEHDAETQEFLFGELGADVYVTDSQGESTLAAVLEQLKSEGAAGLGRVPNLIYRSGSGEMTRTATERENNSLDQNAVRWNLFPDALYVPTVQMRTARSCAFNCAFCRYPIMAGALTLASLETIEAELRFLGERGVRQLVFIDDTFNVPLPRFKKICRMLIANRFPFEWYSFLRCANVDDETFDLMKASGCAGVFLGLESGDAEILTNMNKHADPGRYRYGIDQLKQRDITTFACLIVGFPGETRDSVRRTLEFLQEAAPTFYRCEVYYHYTNVPIHQQAGRFGIKGAGYSWEHATMDWRDACGHLVEIYRAAQTPLTLPGYMFDFWAIPYLRGKGLSIAQIRDFVSIGRDLIVDGLATDHPDTSSYLARLLPLCATFTPAPASSTILPS